MRTLVFALEFRGLAGPAPGSPTERRARTSAPSQTLSAVIVPDGVNARFEPIVGEQAVLESRVERASDGTFVEDGTIVYGSAGSVTFKTIGRGWVGPAAIPGTVHGGIVWEITGGDGSFAGARGIITSNFVVTAEGEVTDNQYARLYVP
jgi:hypothetical protein